MPVHLIAMICLPSCRNATISLHFRSYFVIEDARSRTIVNDAQELPADISIRYISTDEEGDHDDDDDEEEEEDGDEDDEDAEDDGEEAKGKFRYSPTACAGPQWNAQQSRAHQLSSVRA
jgi:hypothetical protein